MRNLMVIAAVLLIAAGTFAQTPTPELKVGDKAPDSLWPARTARPTSSPISRQAGGRGRMVPKAFTGGCTIECKSLAEHGDLIKKYEVTYFMASVDEVEGEGNKAFAEAHKADFPLLSDPTKATAKAYAC